MQPANVVKTLLQGRGTASQLSNLSFKLLTRGAGAQFVMSLPHGAFNYATLEVGVIPDIIDVRFYVFIYVSAAATHPIMICR